MHKCLSMHSDASSICVWMVCLCGMVEHIPMVGTVETSNWVTFLGKFFFTVEFQTLTVSLCPPCIYFLENLKVNLKPKQPLLRKVWNQGKSTIKENPICYQAWMCITMIRIKNMITNLSHFMMRSHNSFLALLLQFHNKSFNCTATSFNFLSFQLENSLIFNLQRLLT